MIFFVNLTSREDDGEAVVSVHFVEIVDGAMVLFFKKFNVQVDLIYRCPGFIFCLEALE